MFIDVQTKKSGRLQIQKHQRDELVTSLKLIYKAGSRPLAVFLLGPDEGYNTKPANRMGPLRLSVLQEEGRPSRGPTWCILITSGTYCRCQRDIVASDNRPVVIKVTMTGAASVAGTSPRVKSRPQNRLFCLPSWNWMQPCSRGPHLWPALTSQVKGLRDRGAYWECRLLNQGQKSVVGETTAGLRHQRQRRDLIWHLDSAALNKLLVFCQTEAEPIGRIETKNCIFVSIFPLHSSFASVQQGKFFFLYIAAVVMLPLQQRETLLKGGN